MDRARIYLIHLILLFFCPYALCDYGFMIKHEGKIPITKFTVIAERCSGSNYMEALLMFNTKVATTPFFHKHFPPWYELPLERYLGEPAFYTFEGTDDYLFIVIVRHPYDWVRSLHKQPHLASRDLFNIPFNEFIHKKWQLDKNDPTYQAQYKLNSLVDCHPKTGAPFDNVLQLRTAKLRNMLMIRDKAKNVYYINYETVRDFPKEILEEISKHFHIALNSTYYPITHYKGHAALPLYRKSEYTPLTPEQVQYINSQLDPTLEKELGYDLECDLN